MDAIELNVKVRSTVGNGPARALRRDGMMPAVLYGRGTEPVSLSVQIKDLENILKHGSMGQTLINLNIEGGDTSAKTVLIKELQTHPMTNNFLHADFYEIDMNRKITVSIPVTTTGKSKGVEMGGILQVIRRELDVSCFPNQIPESIEVDVTDLEMGDAIHVEEIPVSEEIEILYDVNFTVITVVAPKVEEVAVEEEEGEEGEEEAEAAEAAEPEESESTE